MKIDSHDGALKRPQRSAARGVKKRSASWTDCELKAALTEYQPYKAARSIHSFAGRVEYASGPGGGARARISAHVEHRKPFT
jgi:hypothetical protein